MAEPPRKTSLRDHLLTSLSALPSSHNLHLTLLSSFSKRTSTLFPHAHHPPRCFEREYLIGLSCNLDPPSLPSSSSSSPDPTVLVSALSAYLYTIPTASPATSILYISKLDSSGYSPVPHPFTRTLITAFIAYHVRRATRPSARVFVQLFARSQGQYLFANSSSGGGKRVVGGLRLCGWWKGVYEDVARRILGDGVGVRDGRGRGVEGEGEGGGGGGVGLSYLLPRYSESEAAGMLGAPKRALPDGVRWSYAPPCSIPILMRTNSESSLATLIPSLPDDPRSRFLTELVSDAAPPDLSPRKAKREVDGKALSKKEREAADDDEERRHAHSALSRVSSEEFWERMAFRQECSSGDVTGFFVLNVDNPPSANLAPEPMGDPKRWSTDLSPAILERLLTALLNVDFGNRDLAVEGSAMWLKSVHAIVRGEVGEEGWKGCIGELEGKVGMEVKSVEKRKEEVVTVLQPRKKKKA